MSDPTPEEVHGPYYCPTCEVAEREHHCGTRSGRDHPLRRVWARAYREGRATALDEARAEAERLRESHAAAEAEVATLREKLRRVEALCAAVDKNPIGWGGSTVVSLARSIRAALAQPVQEGQG